MINLQISSFAGVVMEIIQQDLAPKTLERAEESLWMAIDAAGLASYFHRTHQAHRYFIFDLFPGCCRQGWNSVNFTDNQIPNHGKYQQGLSH